MIDLHTHMLPGLDDGATNWKQSLAMARMAVEDGIEEVVCTPHWVAGCFENRRKTIVDLVYTFQEKLDAAQIPLKVYPGAELHLDFDLPRKLESGEVASINDMGRFALIELPSDIVPQNMRHFFWELLSRNITPIIGHPERNNALRRHPSRLFRWVQMGAITQVTAGSLAGRFGTNIRRFAVSLLEHHLVHILATDAHGIQGRIPKLSEGYLEARKIVGEEMARQMVIDNPQQILNGEPVVFYDPIPYRKSSPRSPLRRLVSFLGLGRSVQPS